MIKRLNLEQGEEIVFYNDKVLYSGAGGEWFCFFIVTNYKIILIKQTSLIGQLQVRQIKLDTPLKARESNNKLSSFTMEIKSSKATEYFGFYDKNSLRKAVKTIRKQITLAKH